VSRLIGAVEAGGTKVLCAAGRAGGGIIAETRIPTTTPADTLGAVQRFFANVTADFGALAAIGVATFGPVDVRRASPTFGRLLATPKPGWAGTDWVAPLAARFGCPVAIDTDVGAAALAEALHGAGRGCGTVVYVTVGTGIGGGIAIDGRTQNGSLHPEMGHIGVRRHERDGAFGGLCPFHGDCLEGLASGPAIAARYGAALDALPTEHEAASVVGFYLGQLAATALLMLSPERIVFGGGVMNHAALLPAIRRAAAKLLNGYAGIVDATLERVIVPPGLSERSGIVGALALAEAALRQPTEAASGRPLSLHGFED
jgi:fructokinase